ncbi:hypothetical protein BH23BAC4_BH23BAC4_08920 [soil metagenome]
MPALVRGAALCIVALCVWASEAVAQTEQAIGRRTVELVYADSVVGGVVQGEEVRRLFGNVHLRQDTTNLFAREATEYPLRNEILFRGNVRITTPSDTITAPTIRYNTLSRLATATGTLRVTDGESVLTAPEGEFNRITRVASFSRGAEVIQQQDGANLTAQIGSYDFQNKTAILSGGVRLADSTSVLTSDSGRYDVEARRADFFGGVRVEEALTIVDADSLTYFRETRVALANGNVRIERFGDLNDQEAAPPLDRPGLSADADATRRTLLFGSQAFHDDIAGYTRITGGPQGPSDAQPFFVGLRADTTGAVDTLMVRAQSLEAFRVDSLEGVAGRGRRVIANTDVRIIQGRLSAIADSMVVLRFEPDAPEGEPLPLELQVLTESGEERQVSASEENPTPPDSPTIPPVATIPAPDVGAGIGVSEILLLYKQPGVWYEDSQITGDTIRVVTRDAQGGSIDSLQVLGTSFVAQEDTAVARIRQIQGQYILALFDDQGERIRLMSVWPNAETIYFTGENGEVREAVQASADSLAFLFREDRLREISGRRGIEGTAYSNEAVPDQLQLSGFRWEPERRPTRAALMADLSIPELNPPSEAPSLELDLEEMDDLPELPLSADD